MNKNTPNKKDIFFFNVIKLELDIYHKRPISTAQRYWLGNYLYLFFISDVATNTKI